MTMITQVFTHSGETKTVASAYTQLVNLNPTDKYNNQKAAGSLGGASRWGFIALTNGVWERMR